MLNIPSPPPSIGKMMKKSKNISKVDFKESDSFEKNQNTAFKKRINAQEKKIKNIALKKLENFGLDLENKIEVSFSQGVLWLTGQVINREMKKIAEILVENTPGVKDVRNELKLMD